MNKTKDVDPILKQGVGMNRALIGGLIKKYLKDNQITITTLADAAGVSREQVGWLMTGNRDPRLNTLLKVLVAMKFTLLIEVEE
jgi:transcriptional regulator with XRE-family HTH domain